MSTSASIAIPQPDSRARRNSILLVFACTVLGSAAQLLIKSGMSHFQPHLTALLTNVPLIARYTLYGINTLMMVLALTYVWTTLLSYTVLGEHSNFYKNLGIITIVIGVAVMGRRGKQ